MSDDRWRDTYDAWKLASADDERRRYDPLCHCCGSEDQVFLHGGGWLCGSCIEKTDAALRRPADAIEDLDERCGP